MAHSVLKFYASLYRNSGKIAMGLGSVLLIKNSVVHVFPKHFRLAQFGSLDVDIDEMGSALKLYTQVCDDLKMETLSVQPFVAETFEPISAGILAFGEQKSVIGIPRNYYCDYVHEITELPIIRKFRMQQLGVQHLEEVSETPSEIAFMQSLLLTHNAKKFTVARHLMYLKKHWPVVEAVTPSFFVLFGYLAAKYFPAVIFRSRAVNFTILYGFSMLCVIGAWLSCKITKSALNYKMHQSLDEKVTAISPDYAQGAVDFYSSLLKYNTAMRVLLGKQGNKKFTVYGNNKDSAVFTKFGPPITERKDKYEHLVKEKHKSLET